MNCIVKMYIYFTLYVIGIFSLSAKHPCEKKCGECSECILNFNISKSYCRGDMYDQIYEPKWPDCPYKDYCKINNPCPSPEQCYQSFASYYCDCGEEYHGRRCEFRSDGKQYAKNVSVIYFRRVAVTVMTSYMIIVSKLGDDIQVLFDSGQNEILTFNKKSFYASESLRKSSICQEENDRLCDLFPIGSVHILKFSSAFYYVHEGSSLITELFPFENNYLAVGTKNKFSVTVYNGASKEFFQEYQQFIYYGHYGNATCAPYVKINNCGVSPLKADKFPRGSVQTLRGVVRPHHNSGCSPKKDFFLEWKIWKFYLNHDELKDNLYKQFTDSEKYSIPPYSHDYGTYKVKLYASIDFSLNSRKFVATNYALCFFEIIKLPLSPRIRGGKSRNINSGSDLILDASKSYDLNEPPSKQSHLNFIWTCDLTDDFCKVHETKDKVRRIKGPFQEGKVYLFNLTITAVGYNPVTTTQKITIVTPDHPTLKILCYRNCGGKGYKSNPEIELYFMVTVTSKHKGIKVFDWKYSEESGPEEDVHNIKQDNLLYNVLIVKPNMLKEGKEYTFIVRGGEPQGIAETKVIMNIRPIRGNCKVSPLSGIIGQTQFTINCTGFYDEDSMSSLRYEFFNKKKDEEGEGIIIGRNSIGILESILLAEETIIVRVSDMYGMHTEDQVSVQISSPVITEETVDGMVTQLKNMTHYVDTAGTLRLISIISTMSQNIKNKTKVTNFLLNTLNKGHVSDLFETKIYSKTLEKVVKTSVTNIDYGLSADDAIFAANVMNKVSKQLLYEVQHTAQVRTKIKANEVDTISMSLIKCASVIVNSSDTVLIHSTSSEIDTLAAFNTKEKFEQATALLISSFEKIGEAIEDRLLPSEKEVSSEDGMTTFWVKVDSPMRLMNISNIPFGKKTTLKISPDLAANLEEITENICLEMVVFTENPFWWDKTTKDVNTEILSLRMWDRYSSTNLMSVTKVPVDVYLNIKEMILDKVSGSVVSPNLDSTLEEKDISIAVHRIEVPFDGDGRIYLKFLNMKTSDNFKVLILNGLRPDYDSMMEYAQEINSSTTNYVTSFSSTDDVMFSYVGILPGPEVGSGVQLLYEFEIYNVQCQTRVKNIWSSSKCRVGDETTSEVVHCQCKHLSVFGAWSFVPPNKVDPISDLRLFLTVTENPAVVLLVSCIFCFYLIGLFWAIKTDSKNKLQGIILVLEDNFPGEDNAYLITTYTGFRYNAGTTSNVAIQIFGTNADSRVHILRSSLRKTLNWHCDDWFLMFTSQPLGEMRKIHVWHDNSGSRPSWYCEKIVIQDIKTRETYIFLLEKWVLGVETILYTETVRPAKRPQVFNWDRMALNNLFYNFREAHLWLGVIYCHPRSVTPRSHRLTGALFIIMITLLISIMYYGVGQSKEDIAEYNIGQREIIIAVETMAFRVPLVYIHSILFRKSRELSLESITDHENKKTLNDIYLLQKKERRIKSSEAEGVGILNRLINNWILPVTENFIVVKSLIPLRMHYQTETIVHENKMFLTAAWIISQLVIWISGFFIMLYGLKMGKVKSEMWLSTALISIWQGMILSSPIKLVLFSVLLALVYEKTYNLGLLACDLKHVTRQEMVGRRDYLNMIIKYRSLPMYHPLPNKVRKKILCKLTDLKKWRMLGEFLCILVIFILVLYFGMDTKSSTYQSANGVLKKAITLPKGNTSVNFYNIQTNKRFISYLLSTFLSAVHTREWYNGMNLTNGWEQNNSIGWALDYNSRILGVPRIRQLRVKKGACAVPKKIELLISTCKDFLDRYTEDKDSYKIGWTGKSNKQEGQWIYVPDGHNSNLYGISGQFYHSGGYIKNLEQTYQKSVGKIMELSQTGWIDKWTQIIFVELNSFNLNTNTLFAVTLIIEYLPTGITKTTCQVMSMKRSYISHSKFYLHIMYLLFLIFINIHELNNEGIKCYISRCESIIDILLIYFIVTLVFVYISINEYVKVFNEVIEKGGQDRFISFMYIRDLNYLAYIILGIIVCLTGLRLMTCLKFGKRFYNFYYNCFISKLCLLWITISLLVFIYFYVYTLKCIFKVPYIHFTVNLHLINVQSSYQEILYPYIMFIITMKLMYCCYAIIIIHNYRKSKYYKLSISSPINLFTFVINTLKLKAQQILQSNMVMKIRRLF